MSSAKIAELNDRFRKHGIGNGCIVVTRSVRELGSEFERTALRQVRAFDAFTPDNDPYGERDFGSFELEGHQVFWKLEYFDLTLTHGSEDPSDPLQTCRVITVMLAQDY
jgi:hypothetical protein